MGIAPLLQSRQRPPACRSGCSLGRKERTGGNPWRRQSGRGSPRTAPLPLTMLVLVLSCGIARVAASPGGPETMPASQGASQEPGESKGPERSIPRIALDDQTSTPGTNVVLPLYYTPAQGVELRSLVVDIAWISKHLRFVRAQRGVAAEMIGADVSGRVTETRQDSQDRENSVLQVAVSAVEENPRQGLPEGLLAYLIFRVSPDAQPFAIALRPKLVSALDISSPPRKIDAAELVGGKVGIELPGLPPYVTCFFFNH